MRTGAGNVGPVMPERSLRILVVEDEAMVAMMVEDLLADLGHCVVGVAARLDQGLALSESLSFDVAIIDLNLHGQLSTPIAERLVQRGLPFVLMTGYRAELPAVCSASPVLHKPFRSDQIQAALDQALGFAASATEATAAAGRP